MRRVQALYRRFLLHLLQIYLSGKGWRADCVALYLSQRIDRMDAEHFLTLAGRRRTAREGAPHPAPFRSDEAA
jgi:hypothetical protein